MRVPLAVRDISTVYRLFTEAGISHRQIAHAMGQSQREVSEILLKGRPVMTYDVLARIHRAARWLAPMGAAQRR